MPIPHLIPAILSLLLLAAHFLYRGYFVLIPIVLAAPFMLFLRLRPSIRLLQVLLVIGAVEWCFTGYFTVQARLAAGRNPIPSLLIYSVSALFILLSAFLLNSRRVLDAYPHDTH